MEMYNYSCAKCGYAYLEIHHKDRNPANNSLDNLVPLCKECHYYEHLGMKWPDVRLRLLEKLPSYDEKLKERVRWKLEYELDKEINELVSKIVNEIINRIHIPGSQLAMLNDEIEKIVMKEISKTVKDVSEELDIMASRLVNEISRPSKVKSIRVRIECDVFYDDNTNTKKEITETFDFQEVFQTENESVRGRKVRSLIRGILKEMLEDLREVLKMEDLMKEGIKIAITEEEIKRIIRWELKSEIRSRIRREAHERIENLLNEIEKELQEERERIVSNQ
ncbi:hypothetical protein E3E31_08215 [Thermococcus sp. M39]|uniref:HNH endonuclease signature motif containing protein n=1 Tax=Thermococcus sp. M39 TaxID=1638262 RepID=UPI00143C66A4|nr:HNH endonuclease signature motif containing protein [Thermococcus sp. M39]NJE08505.1 hypothetical protein [Thermococcus sp. M39]